VPEQQGDENQAPESSLPEELSSGARLAARKAAKAARKAAQKGTAPVVPDTVTTTVSSAGDWLQENRQMLIGSTAAAAVLIVGILGFNLYRTTTAHGAGALLSEAVEVARTPVASPELEAPEEEPGETHASTRERAEKAVAAYRKVFEECPGSVAAAWGHLGAGKALYDLGKYADARKAYESVIAAEEATDFLKWRAFEGLAFSLEAEKKYDEAARRLEQLGRIADGEYKPAADFHRARMMLLSGDQKKGVEILKTVVRQLQRKSSAGRSASFRFVYAEARAKLLALGYTVQEPRRQRPRTPAQTIKVTPETARRAKMPADKSNKGGSPPAGDGK
jgi:tetratricopeptide (TPR) repeat protein